MRVFTLLLVLPVSSCEAFSSLRRLKKYLRSMMAQSRLNSIAVLHVLLGLAIFCAMYLCYVFCVWTLFFVCCAMLQPDGIFNWDMNTQGLVLGAFFYGYAMTNIVGGMLAQRMGGKLLMLLGVFWTAVMTLLTPILTVVGGFGAIFVVRLLEGIGEVSTLMSHQKHDCFELRGVIAELSQTCLYF